MAITAVCPCGASYRLKDEFAGRRVKCPKCQVSFSAPQAEVVPAELVDDAPPPPPVPGSADRPVSLGYAVPGRGQGPANPFDHDKFLLRQKRIAINQKYYLNDEANQPLLYVERPAHVLRNLGATLAGLLSGLVAFAPFVVAAVWASDTLGEPNGGIAMVLLLVVGFVAMALVTLLVGVPLSAKRHVGFYRDESKADKLMEILQDRKLQLITWTFTARDPAGNVLAYYHKNVLYNLFRKRWVIFAPNRTNVLAMAREDSVILSLLRRFLGPMYGLLRTNFVIHAGTTTDELLGEFNRKFTLFDRYVLDLTPDVQRELDRRIAVGLGVMLDTGERR